MYEECPHHYRAFNEVGELVTMACDSWECPVCARSNAFRWAERVRYGISLRADADAIFWTLTLPAWVQSPRTGFRILPDLWDKLRREMQAVKPGWDYAAFVECHPHRNFIPHFHLITFTPSPYRLKDLAVHCGFGYMAKELQISGKHAAGYVTKYASKQGYDMPRHFRRVRVSRGWPSLPKPVYDRQVYPKKAHEAVTAYVRRIAILTGEGYSILMARWLA